MVNPLTLTGSGNRNVASKHFGMLGQQVLLSTLLCLVVGPAAGVAQDVKIPDPDSMTLETKDGVRLRCTWYAGTEGKKTVPIIMLHGWGGVRGDYSGIASYLQNRGYAVIVPDLRGHGRSTRVEVGGNVMKIERDRMRKQQIAGIGNDIERVKQFLMQKNNEGELNIELLCVVAAGEMSVIAMNWAIRDWSWPQLIGRKQGQDVKGMILLSPKQSFKGLTATNAMRNTLFTGRGPFTLSLMIMVGRRDRTALREASRIHSTLERSRPKVERGLKGREAYRNSDLHLVTPNTELQGTKLVDPGIKLDLEREIRDFIRYRLEAQDDEFVWTDRSKSQ